MQLNIYRIPAHFSSRELKEYEFEVDDSFFSHFEYGEIGKGNLLAKVGVVYSSRQVEINLSLKGNLELICDRCLETFIKALDANYVIYGKYGDVSEQDDIDVLWIPEDKHYIDLVPVLFDYINLSLPIKRIHPDDEEGNSSCNIEMIERLNEMGINTED